MIRKAEPWGEPFGGAPDAEVEGADSQLAALLDGRGERRPGEPGPVVCFRASPASDLARALGLAVGSAPPPLERQTQVALPIDALLVEATGESGDAPGWQGHAVNAVTLGTPLARVSRFTRTVELRVVLDGRPVFEGAATTVVVASGQFVDGLDVVPRGHPGDGRIEVQVYALRAGERAAMRARLPRGGHVPHPRIAELGGRRVEVVADRSPLPLVVDREARPPARRVRVEVVPEALCVVV